MSRQTFEEQEINIDESKKFDFSTLSDEEKKKIVRERLEGLGNSIGAAHRKKDRALDIKVHKYGEYASFLTGYQKKHKLPDNISLNQREDIPPSDQWDDLIEQYFRNKANLQAMSVSTYKAARDFVKNPNEATINPLREMFQKKLTEFENYNNCFICSFKDSFQKQITRKLDINFRGQKEKRELVLKLLNPLFEKQEDHKTDQKIVTGPQLFKTNERKRKKSDNETKKSIDDVLIGPEFLDVSTNLQSLEENYFTNLLEKKIDNDDNDDLFSKYTNS